MNIQRLHDYIDRQTAPVCAYVYDLAHLRERTARLRRALPAGCELYYAIKANSDAPVLQALRSVVDGFEVASLGEIRQVRATDDSVAIAFGGPGKTDAELGGALGQRVKTIHVESEHQLRRLDWIARQREQTSDVLLRVNPAYVPQRTDVRMGGEATQFGIDEARIPAAIELARALPGIRLRGLHIHALSNSMRAQSHLQLLAHYFDLARAWERRLGIKFECVNVGGGIGVNYAEPQAQFDWEGFCAGLSSLIAARQPGFRIVFECGRFIAADCGFYLADVTDIKANHGEHFAILRGGTHHFRLPSSWQHNQPFVVRAREHWPYPFVRPSVQAAQVTLCGELCTPKDVLARRVRVEQLRAGDCVIFLLAGAYGWHISHHDFLSHPHPDRVYWQD